MQPRLKDWKQTRLKYTHFESGFITSEYAINTSRYYYYLQQQQYKNNMNNYEIYFQLGRALWYDIRVDTGE